MAHIFEPAIASFIQAVKGKFTKNETQMAVHIEEQMALLDASVRGPERPDSRVHDGTLPMYWISASDGSSTYELGKRSGGWNLAVADNLAAYVSDAMPGNWTFTVEAGATANTGVGVRTETRYDVAFITSDPDNPLGTLLQLDDSPGFTLSECMQKVNYNNDNPGAHAVILNALYPVAGTNNSFVTRPSDMSSVLSNAIALTNRINELDTELSSDSELQSKVDAANAAWDAIDKTFLNTLSNSPTKAELEVAAQTALTDMQGSIDVALGDMRTEMGKVFTEMTYGIQTDPATDYLNIPNRWASGFKGYISVKPNANVASVKILKDEWVGNVSVMMDDVDKINGTDVLTQANVAEPSELIMYFEVHTVDGRVIKLRHATVIHPVQDNVFVKTAKTSYREWDAVTLAPVDGGVDISKYWTAPDRYSALNGVSQLQEGLTVTVMPDSIQHKILFWEARPDGDLYYILSVSRDATRDGSDFFEHVPATLGMGEIFSLLPRRDVHELAVLSISNVDLGQSNTVESKQVTSWRTQLNVGVVNVDIKVKRYVTSEWVAYTLSIPVDQTYSVANHRNNGVVLLQKINDVYECVNNGTNLKDLPTARMNVPSTYASNNYGDGRDLLHSLMDAGVAPWDVEAVYTACKMGGFIQRASSAPLQRWSMLEIDEPEHAENSYIDLGQLDSGEAFWTSFHSASSTLWGTTVWNGGTADVVRSTATARVVAVRLINFY